MTPEQVAKIRCRATQTCRALTSPRLAGPRYINLGRQLERSAAEALAEARLRGWGVLIKEALAARELGHGLSTEIRRGRRRPGGHAFGDATPALLVRRPEANRVPIRVGDR